MLQYGVNMVNSKVMYQQALENFRDFAEAHGMQTLNIQQDTACCLGLAEKYSPRKHTKNSLGKLLSP